MNNSLPRNPEISYAFAGRNAMLEMAQDQLITIEKITPDPFEGSVNNYFKSMKEIEAEFIINMNAAKSSLRNMITDLNYFSQHSLGIDGTHSDLDGLRYRYLEENY